MQSHSPMYAISTQAALLIMQLRELQYRQTCLYDQLKRPLDGCPLRVSFILYELEDLHREQTLIFESLRPLVQPDFGMLGTPVDGDASDSDSIHV